MPRVTETQEYQTLYENYLHVCSELTRMEATNKNLKSENERLNTIIGHMRFTFQWLNDVIVKIAKGGDE